MTVYPRRARVRLHGRDAGILTESRIGGPTRFDYDFQYVAADGAPIAPNLPVRREFYYDPALLPFFDNLLPEGSLYEATVRRLGLHENDRFGVLLGVGGDVMGAVEILPFITLRERLAPLVARRFEDVTEDCGWMHAWWSISHGLPLGAKMDDEMPQEAWIEAVDKAEAFARSVAAKAQLGTLHEAAAAYALRMLAAARP